MSEFRVWVVACRPFAEKIIGGFVETPDGVDLTMQVDGTFSLDEEDAKKLAQQLNRDGGTIWKVYPALFSIVRAAPTDNPSTLCKTVMCGNRPQVGSGFCNQCLPTPW